MLMPLQAFFSRPDKILSSAGIFKFEICESHIRKEAAFRRARAQDDEASRDDQPC